MSEQSAAEHELAVLMIDALNIEGTAAIDIDPEAPLFGDGLGLDSIDALEIGVALQKRYGIKLDPEKDDVQRHFASVADLTELVHSHKAGGSRA